MVEFCPLCDIFLSTPSARRATFFDITKTVKRRDFYPRPPRGGRPNTERRGYPTIYISIHALREEGDLASRVHDVAEHYFYPRPPRGGRQILDARQRTRI